MPELEEVNIDSKQFTNEKYLNDDTYEIANNTSTKPTLYRISYTITMGDIDERVDAGWYSWSVLNNI